MREDISVSEYRKLLVGMMGDTPLGEAVRIRSETDRETINRMTAQEKKIRADWQRFRAQKPKSVPVTVSVEEFRQMMKALSGG